MRFWRSTLTTFSSSACASFHWCSATRARATMTRPSCSASGRGWRRPATPISIASRARPSARYASPSEMKAREPGSRRTCSISRSRSSADGRRSREVTRGQGNPPGALRSTWGQHSPFLAYRAPGQVPDVRNVLPSQPQYGRRSRVQRRAFGMQVPGVSSPQPCPSHDPLAHSSLPRHAAPSGLPSSQLPTNS